MDTILEGLAFAVFLFGHLAAVVATHAGRNERRSDAFEGIRRDPLARVTWYSGG
jgi:hypothetical protein